MSDGNGKLQQQLAEKTGIQLIDLATIETGQASGSAESLNLIAEALNLDADLISIS
ncbi:MAG: helix-turn-helix transcriptional regulator [Candidatus Poribacteria bacterium]|nr:helix-turn-helix transcriptional regulator [Candidatus Poribacteria bacterium]